tara:strand:- start:1376 stop:1741 length:366 start_codon:yes stop_codon:yes gene_type:complete
VSSEQDKIEWRFFKPSLYTVHGTKSKRWEFSLYPLNRSRETPYINIFGNQEYVFSMHYFKREHAMGLHYDALRNYYKTAEIALFESSLLLNTLNIFSGSICYANSLKEYYNYLEEINARKI